MHTCDYATRRFNVAGGEEVLIAPLVRGAGRICETDNVLAHTTQNVLKHESCRLSVRGNAQLVLWMSSEVASQDALASP